MTRAILKEDLRTNDMLIAHAGDEIEVENIGEEQEPVWMYVLPRYDVGNVWFCLVDSDQIQILR